MGRTPVVTCDPCLRRDVRMRTLRAGRPTRSGVSGGSGRWGKVRPWVGFVLLITLPDLLGSPDLFASQIPFEAATRDLANKDDGTRLRSVQMLKDAAYPEAALPI